MRNFAGLYFFVICIGITFLILLPIIVRHEILRHMRLSNGSTLYKSWSATRDTPYTEFYLFTVLNPLEVIRGEKPSLLQLGPYTYRQTTSKVNLTSFPENGTLRYADKNDFIFDSTLSHGQESDNVTMVNLAYLGIAAKAAELPNFIGIILELIEKYYGSELFITKTAKEIIWGYEDPVLKSLSKLISISPIIGLYAGKNGTAGPTLEINDGLEDISHIGKILTVNNQPNLTIWKTDFANQITGSDGSLFPPYLTSSSQVYVYSEGICRSLVFDAGPLIIINYIPTIRFELSNKTLLSPDLNPSNRGYCLDYPICPKSGVIDMRTCMNGAPVMISLPHFNQADQSYRDAVIGMSPRPDMSISLSIEPQTGAILEASQMVQINAIVTQNARFKALNSVANTTLPVGYINGSVFVNPEVSHTIQVTLIWPQLVAIIVFVLFIILGTGGLIVSLLQLARRHCSPPTKIVLVAAEETTPLLNDNSSILQQELTDVEV